MGLAAGVRYGKSSAARETWRRAREEMRRAVRQVRQHQTASGELALTWLAISSLGEPPSGLLSLPADRMSRLRYHGHSLEWLMVGTEDAEFVSESWIHHAVSWLLDELSRSPHEMEYGVHSHCLHALRLYQRNCQRLGVDRST